MRSWSRASSIAVVIGLAAGPWAAPLGALGLELATEALPPSAAPTLDRVAEAWGSGQAVAKPPRRKRKSRKRAAPPPPPAPEPAPEAAPIAPVRRGPTRIDFDERLIRGQTNTSGAVVLFARKATGLRSLVDRRKSFRERTLRTVFDR